MQKEKKAFYVCSGGIMSIVNGTYIVDETTAKSLYQQAMQAGAEVYRTPKNLLEMSDAMDFMHHTQILPYQVH